MRRASTRVSRVDFRRFLESGWIRAEVAHGKALTIVVQHPYRVLANSMALASWRNGPVENLHCGRVLGLRKIFEVDPLLCTCGAQMKTVSFITEPRVVDRILRHLASEACKGRDPFEPRAPPAAASPSPT